MRISGAILSLAIATAVLMLGHGCSDVRLVKAPHLKYRPMAAKASYCTTKSDTIQSNLKFIFVMDRSGSNQQRYDLNNNNAPLPGTDPTGTRRFDALMRFVQSFQSDPLIYWSMLNFATDVLGGSNYQGFTNNRDSFLNFVDQQQRLTATIDGGSTNYQAALDRVQNMILEDVEKARAAVPMVSSNYVVFFVSDGEPIVNSQLQDMEAILNRVRSIGTIQTNERLLVEGIQINTGYYFSDPVSPSARDYLNNVALDGGGDFLEFAAGQEIDFTRFAIPTRISKFDLKEVWVQNLNTSWYGDYLDSDKDMDGLPDDLEATLGSFADFADSDGNGVSDAVEYKISGGQYACRTKGCSKAGADPYTTCRSLQLPAGSPTIYGDLDKDFLNDCEEKLLGSDASNPDSNNDYVPDDLAFRAGIKIIEVSNAGHLDPDNDQVTDYREIKLNTPIRYHNAKVPGLIPMKYTVNLVSTNSEQDCYSISVSDIVTRTERDLIRIYLMENTKALNERRIMRTFERRMSGGMVSFSLTGP